MHLTVCGMDPGKSNFAYSIVKVAFEEPFRYKVVTTGMVENVVFDLTKGVRQQSKLFKREAWKILKTHQVDVLVAERYQNRGRMRGNTIELVNYMLGVLDQARTQDYVVITASQWKNAFNRFYCLKDFYGEVELVEHRIDATLIALYGAYQYLDVQAKQFSFLDTTKSVQTLRERIGKTNG